MLDTRIYPLNPSSTSPQGIELEKVRRVGDRLLRVFDQLKFSNVGSMAFQTRFGEASMPECLRAVGPSL